VTYEQIHPEDPFGQTMIQNLQSRGAPLLGIDAYPNLQGQINRFHQLGFSEANAWDMNDVYRYLIPQKETQRIEKLELFDEFEEWNMIQAHYCIAMGATSKFFEQYGKNGKCGLIGLEKTISTKSMPNYFIPQYSETMVRRGSYGGTYNLTGPPSPSLSPLPKRGSFSGLAGALPLTISPALPTRDLRFREIQRGPRVRQNSDTVGDISPGTTPPSGSGVFGTTGPTERRSSNTTMQDT